ncbi:hypothetical protein [Mesorhizobium sp.]|uniref:hypothetical protein n=1 Tax=Mesorhizobium sp. TaxID=1871066 RepID=UPI003452BFCC
MEVGDDQTVLRDDEAGAMAAGADALDAAHRRPDAVDGVGDGRRIGVQQRVVGLEFFGSEGHRRVPM